MRVKIIFVFLLALALQIISGPSRWTAAHNTANTSCSLPTSSCLITIPATTQGNVGVIFMITASNLTISSITGGVTLFPIPGCQQFQSGPGATDGQYTTSLPGGLTQFTVNLSGTESSFLSLEWHELRNSAGSATFDKSGSVPDATCTACAGVPLALTGNSDAVIQTMAVDHSFGVPIVNFPYVAGSDPNTSSGLLLNVSGNVIPVFNQTPTGLANGCAVAFK
jgi:hypothetical protein